MFKRILSALVRKKVDTPASAADSAAAEQRPANADLITVYDAYGRELKMTRKEWRDKVFLPNLHQKWNEADELYNLIVSGLNDGFAANLLPAASVLSR